MAPRGGGDKNQNGRLGHLSDESVSELNTKSDKIDRCYENSLSNSFLRAVER